MHLPRALHIVLGLIAIAGFFLFITACMPSWNPDGSQIVFDYRNPTTKECGVALYDIASGKTIPIYSYRPRSCDQVFISAQWREDGRSVLVFVSDDNAPVEERSFLVEVAPNGDLVRTIKLNDTYFAPAAEVRGDLYLWGDNPIKVSFSTNKWQQIDALNGAYFFRGNDEVLFITGAEGEDRELFAIGSLDPDSLRPHNPTEFRIPNNSQSEFDTFIPPPATDPSGRIAFPLVRKDKTNFIAICDQHGLLRILEPNLDPHSQLGNLQWSPDGSTLYAGVLGSVKKNTSVWSIAEISAESGEVTRIIPVSQMDASLNEVDSSFFYHFPISISPDGRTIATNLAGAPVGNISDSDRALYLIDLSGDNAKVTKIPYPSAQTAK